MTEEDVLGDERLAVMHGRTDEAEEEQHVLEHRPRIMPHCAHSCRDQPFAPPQVLAIVAYEQPVTRADISHTRGTDSSGVIDTLLAKGLIADDPRFGSRGRPAFLVTTEAFLRYMGVGSLADLPPLPAGEPVLTASTVAPE
jgi:hypothetical protein